jgi:SAM-dependent methyltransferase
MELATNTQNYIGTELDVFKEAVQWKGYYSSFFRDLFAGRDILEVGAGIGGTTNALRTGAERSWTCLEPDRNFIDILSEKFRGENSIEVVHGTLESSRLAALGRSFDVVLYIDVLEHVEDDASELSRAASVLKPGGKVVVLSPSGPWLYSEFDKAVGHVRRYTKKTLRAAVPQSLREDRLVYLDSCGCVLSLANRLLLKQGEPSLKQIKFWDNRIIPISRIVDPILRYSFGKSVLGIWEKI